MALMVTKDRVAEVLKAIHEITTREVLIGIPMEEDKRPAENGKVAPIGNAAIGYINEFGLPRRNIPPRAHLIPGVRNAMPTIEKALKGGVGRALQGDGSPVGTIEAALEKSGTAAVSAVKKVIQDKIAPELSRAALLTRWNRQKKRKGKPMTADFMASATPLINTGDYIKSLTYVIRDTEENTDG